MARGNNLNTMFMKIVKKILKAFLVLIILVIVGFMGIIIYAVISDYKPAEKVIIDSHGSPSVLNDSAVISIMTWNIGYCGLDKAMDFFYDGGTKVFTPRENCVQNLSAVLKFLKSNDTVDFIFLQEVDRKSKRSYRQDEFLAVKNNLINYSSDFATNYDVFFVPVPPASPMGKVLSGISILSKSLPSLSTRYAFPGEYGFPKQLFMLDRCFLVNRYPLKSGKELIIINTHNEAFDTGDIRKAQMQYLKNFVLDEYGKGNYVIAGGDWNQCPPDFKSEFKAFRLNTEQMVMSSDYLPSDWKWVYDGTNPSNRTVIEAYDPAKTTTTVIDFFLLSPNVEKISVKCINLNFENSDHNPVIIKAQLQ
jgi:endonuclease/exonuclease/phosphatase family metal-dependent hydrolase